MRRSDPRLAVHDEKRADMWEKWTFYRHSTGRQESPERQKVVRFVASNCEVISRL